MLTDHRRRATHKRRSPHTRTEAGVVTSESTPPGDSLAAYDDAPYQSFPFPQSHPARMAVIATLLGLEPPPLTEARILEVGCAAGGNLIPIAQQLPQSRLLGIDASKNQIELGQSIIAQAGLTNIELRHADIMHFADGDPFDFIIAHGVYSWTPAAVRQRMMEIIKHRLSARGVAYVSYNTFPGWRLRGIARDVMAYATRSVTDPAEKTHLARAMAEKVIAGMRAAGHATSANLEAELERVAGEGDDAIRHDYLEEVNDPVCFYAFAQQASDLGLQYLGEAHFPDMFLPRLPPQLREMVMHYSEDPLEQEQFLDFALVRPFRQSLLCHDDVTLDRSLRPERVQSLRVASNAQPNRDPVPFADDSEVLFRRGQSHLKTSDPLLKAGMMLLWQAWPRCLPPIELLQQVRTKLGQRGRMPEQAFSADLSKLLAHLMHGYGASMLDLRPLEPGCSRLVEARPRTASLARVQARQGLPIVNHLHEVVTPNALERQVLMLCEGTLDRTMLARALEAQADAPTADVLALLTTALDGLARQALLLDSEM